MDDSTAIDAAVLGWVEEVRGPLAPPDGFGISRVAVGHRGAFELVGPHGHCVAAVEPGLRRKATSPQDFPAVGDWVVHEMEASDNQRVALTQVLERQSVVVRRASGQKPAPQIVAANVDVMGVVTTAELLSTGADNDDGHRLERYLVAAAEGGVQAVLVVNKADLAEPDREALADRFPAAAGSVEVLATSAFTGAGVRELARFANDGSTLALAGASGVGKSSLVNCLLGADAVEVGSVSADGSGRHTTIRRELFVIPPQSTGTAASTSASTVASTGASTTAGTVIDTPGLADLVPWTNDSKVGLDQVFADIAQLARGCHFANCSHRHEPDCAVQKAVDSAELAGRRRDVYLALTSDP